MTILKALGTLVAVLLIICAFMVALARASRVPDDCLASPEPDDEDIDKVVLGDGSSEYTIAEMRARCQRPLTAEEEVIRDKDARIALLEMQLANRDVTIAAATGNSDLAQSFTDLEVEYRRVEKAWRSELMERIGLVRIVSDQAETLARIREALKPRE